MQNSAFDPAGTIQCFLSDFVGSAEKLTELGTDGSRAPGMRPRRAGAQ